MTCLLWLERSLARLDRQRSTPHRRHHPTFRAPAAGRGGIHVSELRLRLAKRGRAAPLREPGGCRSASRLPGDSELDVDVREMALDRAHAEEEAPGDLLVVEALRDEREDGQLAIA